MVRKKSEPEMEYKSGVYRWILMMIESNMKKKTFNARCLSKYELKSKEEGKLRRVETIS